MSWTRSFHEAVTESASARLQLIAATYGSKPACDILSAVEHRIQLMLDAIPIAAIAARLG